MDQVNWLDYVNLVPFMLVGLIIHTLKNFNKAYKRPDYQWKIFRRNNWIGFIIALITCNILLIMLTAGVELMPAMNRILASFTLGWTGGSAFRGIRSK
jgi:energy-coupling factor transporter transmembrane protein EcfT